MTNPITNLTNIDFDALKQSMIDFLRQQPQFKDYNFGGSNMSVLLDLLAYNSYQKQFYLNMALSEMFLDTAQLRDSIISHAKELNYRPRSARSAVGYITLQITPNDNPSSIVVPKGTRFSARIDDSVFTFITDQAYTLLKVDGEYIVEEIPVYEGQYVTEYFTVDVENEDQRFVLSNRNIDTRSLEVAVFSTAQSISGEAFTQTETILGHTATSKIFWLQPAENEKYELVFGDDVIGRALEHQNYIACTYRVAKGSVANKATNFQAISSIDGYSNITVTTDTAASGGAEPEDVESIRHYAPRHFEAQGRAVTAPDTETLLKEQFPEIEAISVYGGEDADPPEYGRVLVSVDLSDADGIPESKKTAIIEYIQKRNPSVITPKVVDPEFLYVELVSDVEYDPNRTTSTRNDIKTRILTAIEDFRDLALNDFNIKFILSKLTTEIDAVDAAILGNNSRVRAAVYYVPPEDGVVTTKVLTFQNPLQADYLNEDDPSAYEPAISSSTFTVGDSSVTIEDDGEGVLQLVARSASERTVIDANIGTVVYETGKVTLSDLTIDDYTGEAIKIYAELVDPEIEVSNNKILELSLDDATITVTPST